MVLLLFLPGFPLSKVGLRVERIVSGGQKFSSTGILG